MKKIFILALILIFTVGIVSAVDIDLNSIKAPDSYKIIDDDTLKSDLSGLTVDFEEFELDDINDTNDGDDDDTGDTADDNSFVNNTQLNYTVVSGEIQNTFNFNDELNKMYGSVELVEINGQKYTIMIWGADGSSDEIIKNSTECLKKLNDLNDFKPIDTSNII